MMKALFSKWIKGKTKVSERRRSVVFYRHSYYHFFYLAKALRNRGWDAITVNLEDPNGVNANYYHGEDINLYSDNATIYQINMARFFEEAKQRFDLFHFAGDGHLCFLPEYTLESKPRDIIQWRNLGKKVAYSISGCNSATSQTSVKKWSSLDNGRILCSKCVWENNPAICTDAKNLAWGKKVNKYCDIVFAETLPALDYIRSHKRTIYDPVTMCLDDTIWNPELSIPKEHYIEKAPGELLIYHSMGNYDLRSQNGRNIKGTPAVFQAIERLKAEGLPVRLIFVTNVKNTEVRFIQAQADIIVDQLNAGRYGANAREGMMLGKPVICYINPHELHPHNGLTCMKEIPLVSATEETVYEQLKELVLNPEKRKVIGQASRRYALKWHSAESCAERYEKIYDGLMYND